MIKAGNTPFVQAHRGFSEYYPENTLLAIDKAFEAGVDQVEIDLGLSADGHVVVIHDASLERTTDGQGPVAGHTLEQLRQLDAGSWKAPAFKGERIPTLEEALDLPRGRGRLCIEIKSRGRDPEVVDGICRRLVPALQELGMTGSVVVSAFDLEPLLTVRRLDPAIPLMLIDWDPPESNGLERAIELGLFAWTPKPIYAEPARIERAVAAGLTVQVDVYDLPKTREWAAAGAAGFSANDPAELIAYLRDNEITANLLPAG
jgi:glycerophosphoryl diester phosphodiesterase